MSKPIEDYAMLGDGETAALVSRDGSIDWLCWLRFDDDACFAALLGTAENGHWSMTPVGPVSRQRRRYQQYARHGDRLRNRRRAIGEAAGSPQFTHVSVDDFRIVRDNMAGGHRSTSDRLIPYTLFTDPPLARVGLNETDARRAGIGVRIATLPMSNVLRTEATDETQGFKKKLVGADDDRILGFTMNGSEAGEVLAAIQTAMIAELPYQKLCDAVISHLTVAEGLGPLLARVPERAAT
ncbi:MULTISPECIES: trehalase-like domain-containing protein [unclassified Caballeronia]|uniref:trehalase-like domain-containing protein n=1 Tax=unclassified Caballeronia TaxID=2646786 RepID=UPI002855E40B|nr:MULTISPECIES: trehalase-like domain-containing protein [unclassified Caballeronia]MDR5777073.1 DUF5911 domain-containing protein [Caballeronia sp. LZ002]MDR5798626.1 DUF5911 domain-containing protein [Caballeronia sp. LZ001]MDR5852483.1 DUF5911 domain-containing protein [Caballeronia sp. LZ003]